MVSTRQLGIACLALLVLSIAAVISDADNYDTFTGVIAGVTQDGRPATGTNLSASARSTRLELVTSDNTWDLTGHEHELESYEGQSVTVVGAAQNGTIHVSAIYRPRR